ncbi:MAG: hypothetical protein ABGX22_09780 [Pirellulaceae bacterium]
MTVQSIPDGTVMHAEIKIGGTPVAFYLYVDDVDAYRGRVER